MCRRMHVSGLAATRPRCTRPRCLAATKAGPRAEAPGTRHPAPGTRHPAPGIRPLTLAHTGLPPSRGRQASVRGGRAWGACPRAEAPGTRPLTLPGGLVRAPRDLLGWEETKYACDDRGEEAGDDRGARRPSRHSHEDCARGPPALVLIAGMTADEVRGTRERAQQVAQRDKPTGAGGAGAAEDGRQCPCHACPRCPRSTIRATRRMLPSTCAS